MRRSSRQKKVQYKEFNSDSEDGPDPFDDDSEDDFKPEPSTSKSKGGQLQLSDCSSSDSDLDEYLQKPETLDLKSPFFKSNAKPKTSFDEIEKNILSGMRNLSDSDSSSEEKDETNAEVAALNFQQLSEYARKIEEAKEHVEKYNAKKKKRKAAEKKEDVGDLLTIGEKNNAKSDESAIGPCKSSEFETESDSEKEDWEEVAEGTEKNVVPKEGVEITVEMPDVIKKKKKSVDLLAAVKRRLNRLRKENQVFVHKVHLLCWIAHGNYVNSELNQPSVLAVALSLLPSQQAFPPDRINLKYLEQIVTWYKKTIKFEEKKLPKDIPLSNALITQMNKKQCANRKAFVYIFICILRALGVKCRLVLSLQVEPLKPPSNELCSTSAKEKTKENTDAKNDPITKYVGKKKSRSVPDFGPNSKRKKVEASPKRTPAKQTKAKEVSVETNKEIVTKNKTDTDKKENKVQNNASTKSRTSEVTSTRSVRRTINKEMEKHNDQNATLGKSRKTRSKSENVSEKDNKPPTRNAPEKEQSTKVSTRNKVSETKPTKETDKSTKNTKDKLKSIKSTKNGNAKDNPETEIDSIVAALEKSEKVEVKVKTRSNKANSLAVPVCNDLLDRDEWRRSKSISPQPARRRTRSTYKSVTGEADVSEKPNTLKVKKGGKRLMQVDGADDDDDPVPPSKKLKARSSSIKPIYKEADSESEFSTESPERKPNLKKLRESASDRKTSASEDDGAKSKGDVRSDIVKLVKASMSEQRHKERARKSGKVINYEDSDSDYAPESSPRKKIDLNKSLDDKKFKVKRRIPPKSELIRKVLSSGEEKDEKPKEEKGNNVWIEVFMEDEEKWISVDVVRGKIHCVKDLYSKATHPVSYILSWDNTNRVKDVSKRYCPNWNTVTRKLRIDQKWWDESLRPFLGTQTARDKEEDEDLAQQELDQPLPKTISEYKNHPLYVLKRHLLKFEAIYPPDAITLGFVKDEAVYSRDCVYTLHSREIWLKEAKTVKLGEKPYKIVKARPKFDRLSNQMITDLPLEIFGPWQVQDYEPPTAENGIVPRNAYGNVELFKECMLPKKTVHLRLPGLNKVARKLKIDCASAVVGFDFHSGWNHPTYDGYVVCEEFKETLIDAWTQEQEEIEKREREKYEKRVYGNWKRLIKGLLIRERLKARYDFGQPTEDKSKAKPAKGPRFQTKKKQH